MIENSNFTRINSWISSFWYLRQKANVDLLLFEYWKEIYSVQFRDISKLLRLSIFREKLRFAQVIKSIEAKCYIKFQQRQIAFGIKTNSYLNIKECWRCSVVINHKHSKTERGMTNPPPNWYKKGRQ